MKLESKQIKSGPYGDFTIITAGGDSYGAFKQYHEAFKSRNVGDDIEFTWEPRGKYKQVTSLNGPGVSTNTVGSQSPGGSRPSVGAGTPSQKPDTGSFNVMMATSYAKDLMIGNVAGTVAEAVTIVRDIYDGFVKGVATGEAQAKEVL